MGEFTVSSAAEFMTAIKKAASGDVIKLQSGSYDNIPLLNFKFPGGVTVTSADPNRPAELTGLRINGSEGLTFKNLILNDKTPSKDYDFAVQNSSNINFDKILIQGTETGPLTANPFMIRNSSDVSITNSEVTNVRYGINMLNSNGVTLTNNYFHDIRTDGVRGGGNSDVTIHNNFFTDFRPAATDHPDAIQFWTNGTSASAQNIVITDNVILRGNGSPIQGIFMGDEAKLPYKNVLIDGNVVIGGMYNGISVGNAEGLKITDNTVAGIGDQISWIRATGADVVNGNKAQTYLLNGVNVGLPEGNAYTAPVIDQGRSILLDWLAQNDITFARSMVSSVNYAREKVIDAVAAMPEVELPAFTVITGTDGADRLKAGKVGDFHLTGGDGNDQFTGGVGKTKMEGGDGNDIYYVNSDRDIVIEKAGGGSDTVYTTVDYKLADHVEQLRLSATDLKVHGNDLDNRIVGSEGRDTIYGEAGDDSIMGMAGDDLIDGGDGDDSLSGGEGNDVLIGGRGNDKLFGDVGNDRLSGGDGDDWLEGGAGADILTGGAGKDTFYFRQADLGWRDTITDFNAAEGDKISLSAIDANTATGKDDPFRFIGNGAFSKVAGELRYSAVKGGILVEGDVNGDGVADLSIMLQGVTSVTMKDFML